MLHLCRVLQVLLVLRASLVWAVRPSHEDKDDADDASATREKEARIMQEACKQDHEGDVDLKDLRACVGTLQQYADQAKNGLVGSLGAEQAFIKEYREAAKQLEILRNTDSLAKKMEADHNAALNFLLEDAAEAESKAKSLEDEKDGKAHERDDSEEEEVDQSDEKDGKAHKRDDSEEEEVDQSDEKDGKAHERDDSEEEEVDQSEDGEAHERDDSEEEEADQSAADGNESSQQSEQDDEREQKKDNEKEKEPKPRQEDETGKQGNATDRDRDDSDQSAADDKKDERESVSPPKEERAQSESDKLYEEVADELQKG